eukprot:g14546.t1
MASDERGRRAISRPLQAGLREAAISDKNTGVFLEYEDRYIPQREMAMGVIAKLDIKGYKHDESDDNAYYMGDMRRPWWALKNLAKTPQYLRFGNATQEIATFTCEPVVEDTTTTSFMPALGVLKWPCKGTDIMRLVQKPHLDNETVLLSVAGAARAPMASDERARCDSVDDNESELEGTRRGPESPKEETTPKKKITMIKDIDTRDDTSSGRQKDLEPAKELASKTVVREDQHTSMANLLNLETGDDKGEGLNAQERLKAVKDEVASTTKAEKTQETDVCAKNKSLPFYLVAQWMRRLWSLLALFFVSSLGAKIDSGPVTSNDEELSSTQRGLEAAKPAEVASKTESKDSQETEVDSGIEASLGLEVPSNNFARGSGVAEVSIPTEVAEEAEGFPDDARLQNVVLAKSLGREPCVYMSTSHGVELEVQADSLAVEVRLPVSVSPRLQFVKCRTEGPVSAPSHGQDFNEDFLAMTFVDGPEEAKFSADKPAKLRFFVGYVDEFEPEDDSDREIDQNEIEKQVLAKYRPLTSPDGEKHWEALPPYSVLFPRPVLGDREVWVETALKDFCTVSHSVKINIPGYEHIDSDNNSYFRDDFPGFLDRTGKHIRGAGNRVRRVFGRGKGKEAQEAVEASAKRSRAPMVRFGNATKEVASFTYWTTTEFTKGAAGSGVNAEIGFSALTVAGGKTSDYDVEGCERATAHQPKSWEIQPGRYEDLLMPHTVVLHPQMHVRVGVIENLRGDNPRQQTGDLQVFDDEYINPNRILVLRPPRLKELCKFPVLRWPCSAETIMNLKVCSGDDEMAATREELRQLRRELEETRGTVQQLEAVVANHREGREDEIGSR